MSLSGQAPTVFCTSCRGAAKGSCGLYTAQIRLHMNTHARIITIRMLRNNINEDVNPCLLVFAQWFTVQGARSLYLAILRLDFFRGGASINLLIFLL